MGMIRSITTATVAAALAVSVPVTSANAAVRASQAVPAAEGPSSSSGLASVAWPVWAIAGLTAALAIFIATKSDGKGKLPFSRG